MFFEPHEKLIFSVEWSENTYDPLAIDRALRKESKNQLGRLIDTWQAADRDEGDISESGRLKSVLESDTAEEELAHISRVVFELGDFPECTDGEALEWLCQYLDWCKKKGMRDTTKPDSTTSVMGTYSDKTNCYTPTS